jgi:hypothetical protein
MIKTKTHFLILLMLFALCGKSFSQLRDYADNDPRWNRLNTAVYPAGNYAQLPQKIVPLVRSNVPRVIRTPHEVLIVNPNIQVLPSATTTESELPLVTCRTNPNLMFGSSNAVANQSTINSGSYITN